MPAPRTRIPERGRIPYLRLDHVDAPGAEGLHAVVNVHDALTLGHVQHHIQDDVAARAAGAGAGRERPGPGEGLGKGAQVQGAEKRGPGHLAMSPPPRVWGPRETPSPGKDEAGRKLLKEFW